MVHVRFSTRIVALLVLTYILTMSPPFTRAETHTLMGSLSSIFAARANLYPERERDFRSRLTATHPELIKFKDDYHVRFAFGRTFGTSTQLDYATVEVSKRITAAPKLKIRRFALGEIQVAFLASHVFYRPGTIERVKRLAFEDGFELGFVPKLHFTLPKGPLGLIPYMESGAGIGYVSETYRNSGSRWNWSLLGGMGLQRPLRDLYAISVGIQWRHLSNGNMWGKGDELHNSNSGTDMIQGVATLVRRF